jgi:antitoxin VapB
MAVQIANPTVVAKIEALARKTGLSKTAAVEHAVDRLLEEQPDQSREVTWEHIDELLRQLDQIPDNPNYVDPLQWDENGLPI